MNYPHQNEDLTAARLAAISSWIDSHNDDPSPAAQDARVWGRVAKVAEEIEEAHRAGLPDNWTAALAASHGRAIAELVSFTGQNPRKPKTVDPNAVVKELCDVMVTAAAAIESLTGNQGGAMNAFERRVEQVAIRAGLEQTYESSPRAWRMAPGL